MKLISVLAAVMCVGLPLCFAAAILPTCQDQDLTITVDNELVLYIDGVEITDLPNANNWELADTVILSAPARVIAVRGKDVGVVAGILASAASFVTDNSWRCSNDETLEGSDDWNKPEYDDSNWSAAYVIGNNGMSPWGQIKEISGDAKWIWTSNWEYPQTDNHVTYCRKIIQCSAPPTPEPTPAPTPAPCSGTGQACITSCDGRRDGDYQSCRSCNVYASCSKNILIDDRPCAPNAGDPALVWDDIKKFCDRSSDTCKNCGASAAQPPPPQCSGTGSACITSCDGRKDGDYQSCHGCSVYASCSNNILTDDRPCPLNSGGSRLFWDDIIKKCDYTSNTCKNCAAAVAPPPQCSGTGSACITSCDGRKDGDYQSCHSCNVYASCSNNILTDDRPCPLNSGGSRLFWDDIIKKCDYTSNTCKNCAATVAPPLPCSGTGSACITSCDGRKDGDYQSCHGCSVYAICSNNILTDDRQCPLNSGDSPLRWDDNKKICDRKSNTCKEC